MTARPQTEARAYALQRSPHEGKDTRHGCEGGSVLAEVDGGRRRDPVQAHVHAHGDRARHRDTALDARGDLKAFMPPGRKRGMLVAPEWFDDWMERGTAWARQPWCAAAR